MLVSHILKTDSVGRKQLVAFLQPSVLPCCPLVKDLFDIDGYISVDTPLSPDNAESQPVIQGTTMQMDNFDWIFFPMK